MILFREIELEMITLYQLVPRKMEAAIDKRVRNFLIPPPSCLQTETEPIKVPFQFVIFRPTAAKPPSPMHLAGFGHRVSLIPSILLELHKVPLLHTIYISFHIFKLHG